MVLLTNGCRREFYRRTADRDAYAALQAHRSGPNWRLPDRFSIEPDPRSRFAHTACLVDPCLPVPAPELYGYRLPMLVTRPATDRRLVTRDVKGADIVSLASGLAQPVVSGEAPGDSFAPGAKSGNSGDELSSRRAGAKRPGVQPVVASGQLSASPGSTPLVDSHGERRESQTQRQRGRHAPARLASTLKLSEPPAADELPSPPDVAPPGQFPGQEEPVDPIDEMLSNYGQELVLQIPPIPADAWESLPPQCLRRMLEFEHIREEYQRSFHRPFDPQLLDPAQRVTLENILELALINSREYQLQKEALYRAALRLTFQQFNFDLRFFSRGNGSDTNYTHLRAGGTEVNTLGVPTNLGITRSLYTAGQLVGRFANDVVLTFNGTSGYSSNVSSELLVQLSQPVMQRDIQFEPLTQAERDVVYAARNFVRYRKTLFRDLAVQYYNLLLSYRSIAINTQDYFSNLGGFLRAEAMYAADRIPRFQVDQFEQNALRSRGNLIDACNALERNLDRLKFTLGLPPETPLNLDLSELEDLTTGDEATVVREQIRRTREYTRQQIENEDPSVAIPAAAELARRMLSLLEVRRRLGIEEPALHEETRLTVARFEAEDKRIEARNNAAVLRQAFGDAEVLPAQLFLRNEAILRANLAAISRELRLLRMLEQQAGEGTGVGNTSEVPAFASLFDRWKQLVAQTDALAQRQRALPNETKADELPGLIDEAEMLLAECEALERRCLQALEQSGVVLASDGPQWLNAAAELVAISEELPFNEPIGLPQLDLDVDAAMVTALVQRLDLMNVRGELADAWRQIKYAADALRSVIDIEASQSIRTPSLGNRPFDFSFDDSTTQLSLAVDTPLNRRAERNNYRLALINYNVGLRNLMQAEDQIKLDIRNDIRSLELDRNQYEIAIASAALAYERVASTRLQLATGQGNITARDFLEAQQAYTQSLSAVAQQHIGFILDRIRFFLDLEQLQVDQFNYWPELRNEEYPMIPNADFPAVNPDGYGRLPPGPWYSHRLRHMERVPSGQVKVFPSGDIDSSVMPAAEQATAE